MYKRRKKRLALKCIKWDQHSWLTSQLLKNSFPSNIYWLTVWKKEWSFAQALLFVRITWIVFITLNTQKVNEVAQSCLTLCNPMDCSLPGSSIHGIFQARMLEWVAISFSKKWKLLSPVQLFVTPWAIQSLEFSRPEYWSG